MLDLLHLHTFERVYASISQLAQARGTDFSILLLFSIKQEI